MHINIYTILIYFFSDSNLVLLGGTMKSSISQKILLFFSLLSILVFISAVLLAGILIDILGFDTLWMKRGPMRRFYQQYNKNIQNLDNNLRNNGRGRRSFQ
jgi:hypothetical protein